MDVAAIIGGSVSALLGVVVGLFGDRWLRHRGDVYCRMGPLGREDHRRAISGAPPLKVNQKVQVHFFNDKEVDTGLSELAVVFVYESGEDIVLGPETQGYETSTSPRGVINLPSKTWVTVHISGEFYGPPAKRLLDNPNAIEISSWFPRGTPYHERCSGHP